MAKVKLQTRAQGNVKTYVFTVVVRPDEDRWFAYCPVLENYAATTWGHTRAEAFQHIRELVEMIVDELVDEGIPIPTDGVYISPKTGVAVTI